MNTICAIATARAAAAIGTIRVSGDDSILICSKIIRLKKGSLDASPNAVMRLALIHDGNTEIDEVLCTVFRAPASYTGENTVEINCHGSLSILERVIKLLIKNGARYALPGEFTKRAFLNGKMDLIQAEAVGDLINSHSQTDAALALRRMSGILSEEFNEIFNALVALNTDILAYIDFPDEGLTDVDPTTVLNQLQSIRERILKLEKSFNTGSVIHNGADTVIIGAPNVGKSTFLNAVLGYERAIVSDIAGTTRDMVSERAVMGGVTLNLCDTAGIREKAEQIEQRGIEIAQQSLKTADLVFAVFDGSKTISDDDRKIIELCAGKTAVAIINKCDLPQNIDKQYIYSSFIHAVEISASKNDGIDKLSKIVQGMFLSDKISVESGMLLTNTRHYERAVRARELVDAAIATVKRGFTPDLASVDITSAAGEIGMITGNTVSDKIIDEIFSKFCVGK